MSNPFGMLQGVIAPYAQEARSLAATYRDDAGAYMDRIIRRLDGIHQAILDGRLDAPVQKVEFSFADADSTKELRTVPAGTVWVLEVFQAFMMAGGATVVMEVNGRFRLASSVATSGLNTAGVSAAMNMHLAPGDTISVRTTGMALGEDMRGYIQFRAKPITAPARRTGGQPEQAADRNNDQGEELDRHSTPAVFLGHNVRGEHTARHPNMPPALPRL